MSLSSCINLETGKINPMETFGVKRCIARHRADGTMQTEAGLKDIAVAIMAAHCQLIIERDRIFAEREAAAKAESNGQPA